MVGDTAVHVLDPGETSFRPTVFLQGLKKREAALVQGEERPPARFVPAQVVNRQAPDHSAGDPWHLWKQKAKLLFEGSAALPRG